MPDHQEVYIYHTTSTEDSISANNIQPSDCVLSFEVLSHVAGKDQESVARLLFDDLVVCNEADDASLFLCRSARLAKPLRINHKVTFATGSMKIARGRGRYKDQGRTISASLYILSMPEYNCDMLITYNFPMDDEGINYEAELAMFEELASTLDIIDEKLFCANKGQDNKS